MSLRVFHVREFLSLLLRSHSEFRLGFLVGESLETGLGFHCNKGGVIVVILFILVTRKIIVD